MLTKGDRIHFLRTQKKLTMEELGKKIGVGKGTIKKYENGVIENIPSDKIEALAEALDSTPAYIMGWEEEEEKPIVPKTIEAQIVSFGMDHLPKEDREMILSILQKMFQSNPELFKRGNNNETGL